MTVITVNDPYAVTSAYGFKSNDSALDNYNAQMSVTLNSKLTESGKVFYNKVLETTAYLNDEKLLSEIQEVKDSVASGRNPYEVHLYTEDNYMHITPFMQDLVMVNPYLHKEFTNGDINGFGKSDTDYDDELNKSLYSGIADHEHDTVIYTDSSDFESDLDTLVRVQDVWEFFINGLDNDDDFTNI